MLALTHIRELLFGGAAGGAKSDALLMAALQYVDTPGYNAIIFRKTFPRLESTLIGRAKSWLLSRKTWLLSEKVFWNDKRHEFTFPSGAKLRFGYLDNPDDRWEYQGTEYQFFGFDELTEFALPDDDNNVYLFMNRSARQTDDVGLPIRFRAASNPGNIGHHAVKKRFITPEAEEAIKNGVNRIFETPEGRIFIPSRIADNPSIDEEEYRKGLWEMAPVTRERMMNGDWSVMPYGLIKAEWLKYKYTMQGDYIRFHDADGNQFCVINQLNCRRIITVDTRGTSKEITKESKGKPYSWTVAQVWDIARGPLGKTFLVLRHVWRARSTFTETCAKLESMYREWKPIIVKVENRSMGDAIWDSLRNKISIDTMEPNGDKATRASRLLTMLEAGQVFLPRDEGTWKPILEAEWLGWQGHDEETNDQVDAAAYAAIECGSGGGGVVTLAVDPRGVGMHAGRF